MADIPSSFFYDSNEQTRAVLGQGYVTSIITEGLFSKSIMVLTDRRLYVSGKSFQRNFNNRVVSIKGKQAVDVQNITSTGFQEANQPSLLLITVILFITSLIFFIAGAPWGLSVFFLILAPLSYLLYEKARTRYFFVEYPGGSMGTDCRWFSPSEIETFQRKIVEEQNKIAQKKTEFHTYKEDGVKLFCYKCGKEIPGESVFCSKCGAEVAK